MVPPPWCKIDNESQPKKFEEIVISAWYLLKLEAGWWVRGFLFLSCLKRYECDKWEATSHPTVTAKVIMLLALFGTSGTTNEAESYSPQKIKVDPPKLELDPEVGPLHCRVASRKWFLRRGAPRQHKDNFQCISACYHNCLQMAVAYEHVHLTQLFQSCNKLLFNAGDSSCRWTGQGHKLLQASNGYELHH